MLAIVLAVLVGWGAGRRSTPFSWIFGAVVVVFSAAVLAFLGWTAMAPLEGCVAIAAYSGVALLSGITRPPDSQLPLRNGARHEQAPIAVTIRSRPLA